MEKKIVVENEAVESEVMFSAVDQAETVFSGLIAVADSDSEVAGQSLVASTGIDELEASVREATRLYMRENGFSSCPLSLKGMELLNNNKADYIPRTIASRIKARCDCHATGKSYKIKVSDLPEYAVTSRKGERDWRMEVSKAISVIMKNTQSYYEKNGNLVEASNPVLFSIENKLKKADSLFLHFHTKPS